MSGFQTMGLTAPAMAIKPKGPIWEWQSQYI